MHRVAQIAFELNLYIFLPYLNIEYCIVLAYILAVFFLLKAIRFKFRAFYIEPYSLLVIASLEF